MHDGEVDANISSTVRARKGVSSRFLTLGKKLANAHLRMVRNNVKVMRVETLHTRIFQASKGLVVSVERIRPNEGVLHYGS